MGNHLCVCVCLERLFVDWSVDLMFAAWSMEPNVCKPSNRREVQTPYVRSAQTHTYLHLRTHVRTHSNSLPKKSSRNLSVRDAS